MRIRSSLLLLICCTSCLSYGNVQDFVNLKFACPTASSTNDMVLCRNTNTVTTTMSNGDVTVRSHECRSWEKTFVDGAVMPSPVFQSAVVGYEYETLLPYAVSFTGRFAKGMERNECLRMMDDVVSILEKEYGIKLVADDYAMEQGKIGVADKCGIFAHYADGGNGEWRVEMQGMETDTGCSEVWLYFKKDVVEDNPN